MSVSHHLTLEPQSVRTFSLTTITKRLDLYGCLDIIHLTVRLEYSVCYSGGRTDHVSRNVLGFF